MIFPQPLMSLIFGKLTQQFVVFSATVVKAKAGNPQAIQDLPNIAAEFRRTAALDASYLVYIGRLIVVLNTIS